MTGQCRGGWLEGTGASAGNLTCLLRVARTQNKDSLSDRPEWHSVSVWCDLPPPRPFFHFSRYCSGCKAEVWECRYLELSYNITSVLLSAVIQIRNSRWWSGKQRGAGETVFSYSKLAPRSVCLNQWSELFWWVTVIIFHCLEWIKFSQDKSVLWSSQASPSAFFSSGLPAVLSMEQHWGQMWSQTVRELQDPRASYCSQVRSLASFT